MRKAHNCLKGRTMTDFADRLACLKRPSLLIRAARHGLMDYNRNRDLRRLLDTPPPSPEQAMERLFDAEEALETARREGGAAYSVSRHVEVMIAMLAELRLLNRTLSA